MAMQPGSAQHEMLLILEKRGGSMTAEELKTCDAEGVNVTRAKGTYVCSGFFSRNFHSNAFGLLACGAATIVPASQNRNRIITITEFGRQEITRLNPKLSEKQKAAKEEARMRAMTEDNFKAWESTHKQCELVEDFIGLGFKAVDTQPPMQWQSGCTCPNLRCRANGGGLGQGRLYVLRDGNMEVVVFEHTCGHQYETKMTELGAARTKRVKRFLASTHLDPNTGQPFEMDADV